MSQICITKIERGIIVVLGKSRSSLGKGDPSSLLEWRLSCFSTRHAKLFFLAPLLPVFRANGETGDRVEKGRLRIVDSTRRKKHDRNRPSGGSMILEGITRQL